MHRRPKDCPLPTRSTGLRRTAGVLALVLCCCSEQAQLPPHVDGIRPGQSLLDCLADAELEHFRATNLPPDLHRQASEPLPVRIESTRANWNSNNKIPALWRDHVAGFPGITHWRWKLDKGQIRGTPRILADGKPVPAWDPQTQEFPGRHYWWDAEQALVHALVPGVAENVSVEYQVDLRDLLAGYESFSETEESSPVPPSPTELVRFVTFGEAARRCLFLPAPSALTFSIPNCPAARISFDVLLEDLGYELRDGSLHPRTGGSDGVRFLVQVIDPAGEVHTVWQHPWTQAQLGRGFQSGQADLRPFAGQDIRVRLVSHPGVRSDALFDYAYWSSLRIEAPAERAPSRPHLIVLDVDTLRPDRLGCYGAERPSTPHLDAWAKKARLYRDALAPSSWTVPSTASLLTGLAVHQHLVTTFADRIGSEVPTVADLLREAHYESRAYTAGGAVRPSYGYHQGFDYFHTSKDLESWQLAMDWLRQRRSERPLFLFLQTYMVHGPYQHDPRYLDDSMQGSLYGQSVEYDSVIVPYLQGQTELSAADRDYINALYDAGVARMDQEFHRFQQTLEEVFREQPYLLILTSDHGEEFFEHSQLTHGKTLYQEVLRIPLIAQFPAGIGPGRGISDEPTSLLDVAPTLLEVAGLKVPNSLAGLSLLRPIAEDRVRIGQLRAKKSFTVVQRSLKLIEHPISSPRWTAPEVEFFDLAEDAAEQHNLVTQRPQQVEALRTLLEKYRQAFPTTAAAESSQPLSAGELEALQALGYMNPNE